MKRFQDSKPNVKKLYHRPRRRYCRFCVEKLLKVDWKDVKILRKYISEAVKITSRSKTGACAKHQKMLNKAIKRARVMALLPFTVHQLHETD